MFLDVLYHSTTLNPLHRLSLGNLVIIFMHAPLLVSLNESFPNKFGDLVFLNLHLNSWVMSIVDPC